MNRVRTGTGLRYAIVAASTIAVASVAPPVPERWAPDNISGAEFESHGAFDPRTGDFYFVRSTPQFTRWHIVVSHCGPSGWSAAQPAPFAQPGAPEADPYITPDGRSLYFISARRTDGIKDRGLDIWRVDRLESGAWGIPQRLPAPISSTGAEWFPRPAADGWLYFGSDRPGGIGKTDIWRARMRRDGTWQVENLGAPVNTAGDEYEPLPTRDGRALIVMGDGGLWESRRTARGWSERTPLLPDGNGSEIGAALSPSGKTLLFSRNLKGALAGEFFLWRRGGRESWPPRCGAEAKRDRR